MAEHGPPPQHADQGAGELATSAEIPTPQATGMELKPGSSSDQLENGQRESREGPAEIQVDWEKPHDPNNPMEWSNGRKWTCIAIVTLVTLNAAVATTIITPSTPSVMADFHNDNEQLGSLVTSIYVIALVFGPLVWAPLCEMYGRAIVLNASTVLFLVFNIACAVSTSLPMLLVFRFFVGLGGGVPPVIGGAVIADLMEPQNRARALSGWQLGPLLGPVIGPIIGGFLGQSQGWRWAFWLVAILQAPLVLACLAVVRETYAPVLLGRKAAHLRKETGNPNYRSKFDAGRSSQEVLKRTFLRPIKMLFGTPIVAMLALVISIANGYVYLLFTTFPAVFQGQYGFSTGTSSLAYIGSGIGFVSGLAFAGTAADRLTVSLTTKHGERKPEYRLPPLIVGAFTIPIGLIMYGWTAQYKIHWIVPMIGTTIIGFGVICVFLPIQAYLIDAFTVYAASAGATNTVVRSVFGALLPLAGPPLYGNLGLGWGNTLLGLIALATAPIPFFLLRYGERIRTSQKFQLDL